MLDVILDTLIDSLKLLPFLFVTYLILEWIEHRAGEKTEAFTAKAGVFGPAVGGLLGAIPQCGFSASAANLFSGGMITVGTLLAVFLSTSDEMLPIMLSRQVALPRILLLLAVKAVSGVAVGFLADILLRLLRRKRAHRDIAHLCEENHCHCEKGILHSAIHHTVQIALFILLISFAMNTAIYFIGEDTIASLTSGAGRFFLPFITGLIGLIPNCASSVVLTELFLDGLISTGAVVSGLLSASGVGLLILFRVNKNIKENFCITAVLYGSGVVIGLAFDLLKIVI